MLHGFPVHVFPWTWKMLDFTRAGYHQAGSPYDGPPSIGSLKGIIAVGYNETDFLTPGEAFLIDTKIDDGQPGTGRVLGSNLGNGCIVLDNLAEGDPGNLATTLNGDGDLVRLHWDFAEQNNVCSLGQVVPF